MTEKVESNREKEFGKFPYTIKETEVPKFIRFFVEHYPVRFSSEFLTFEAENPEGYLTIAEKITKLAEKEEQDIFNEIKREYENSNLTLETSLFEFFIKRFEKGYPYKLSKTIAKLFKEGELEEFNKIEFIDWLNKKNQWELLYLLEKYNASKVDSGSTEKKIRE
jgi:hypothetical protein